MQTSAAPPRPLAVAQRCRLSRRSGGGGGGGDHQTLSQRGIGIAGRCGGNGTPCGGGAPSLPVPTAGKRDRLHRARHEVLRLRWRKLSRCRLRWRRWRRCMPRATCRCGIVMVGSSAGGTPRLSSARNVARLRSTAAQGWLWRSAPPGCGKTTSGTPCMADLMPNRPSPSQDRRHWSAPEAASLQRTRSSHLSSQPCQLPDRSAHHPRTSCVLFACTPDPAPPNTTC